jgi:hypothetical protein
MRTREARAGERPASEGDITDLHALAGMPSWRSRPGEIWSEAVSQNRVTWGFVGLSAGACTRERRRLYTGVGDRSLTAAGRLVIRRAWGRNY